MHAQSKPSLAPEPAPHVAALPRPKRYARPIIKPRSSTRRLCHEGISTLCRSVGVRMDCRMCFKPVFDQFSRWRPYADRCRTAGRADGEIVQLLHATGQRSLRLCGARQWFDHFLPRWLGHWNLAYRRRQSLHGPPKTRGRLQRHPLGWQRAVSKTLHRRCGQEHTSQIEAGRLARRKARRASPFFADRQNA